MAVLKDLIVHGPSRFINTAQFESLKTNKIGAEEGVFNKIVATTGDIGSLTVEDLTAGKATILSLLDVRGELHTNQWTNSNIATIDGSFYITPTIGVPSGTMTTTANSVVVNGSNFPISSLYVNGVNSDNTATTVAWTSGSKVLVTGEILVNGVYMPLGTLIGTLSVDATTSQIQVGSITDNRYQTAESLAEIGTQSTALPCRNVKVSLYQTSRSSTLYPLGIFMTALGENGKTFLDIYGGGYATSTATAGGFAKPVLRIGNLAGLPAVGGKTPVGYGIYTSNGYFSGTIVSKSGTIGGYTLDDTSLYSGTKGNSTTSGHFTLTTGTFTRAIDGTSRSNLQIALGAKFGVANDGTLYANGANITNINANNISTNMLSAMQAVVSNLSVLRADMGTITAGVIKHDTVGGSGGIWISADTDTSSNITVGNSGAIKTWRLLINNTFGVTSAGKLYATGADITGAITATSFEARGYSGTTLQRKATVDTTGLNVYDGSNNLLSQFGTTSTIGRTSGNNYNVYINDSAINLRYNTNVLNETSSRGMIIYDGNGTDNTNIIAKFGSVISLGKEDSSRIDLNVDNFIFYDKNTLPYFKLGQAGTVERNSITSRTMTATDPNGGSATYTLSSAEQNYYTNGTLDVVIHYNRRGIEGVHYNIEGSILTVSYDYLLGEEQTITILTYNLTSNSIPYLTFGSRKGAIGQNSVVIGLNCAASGSYSYAQGEGTQANGYCQTVIGRYNTLAPSSAQTSYSATNSYPFIIGKGTSSTSRSNAFTVDWSGNVNIASGAKYKINGTDILQLIYPVGSIYMSVNSTSPATLFGGTWTRITGKFLLAATDNGSSGASQAAGNTGGAATVTLTAAQSGLPEHTHTATTKYAQTAGTGTARYHIASSGSTTSPNFVTISDNTAQNASEAHENMPPYLAVYVWKRTA